MKKVKTSMYLVLIMTLLAYSNIFAGKNDTLIQDEWATVKSLVGEAEIRKSSSEKWREAHVGMRVKMEWDVRTHIESSLELAFESGSIIKLGENSEVSLSKLFNTEDVAKPDSNVKVVSEKDSIGVISITDKTKKDR